MNKVNFRRMDNVVRVLDEAPTNLKNSLDMGEYFSECGSPACVLGHYASRPDVQRLLRPGKRRDSYGGGLMPVAVKSGRRVGLDSEEVLSHFGITYEEAEELFGGEGCGGATTTKAAAKYVKQFIKEKRSE